MNMPAIHTATNRWARSLLQNQCAIDNIAEEYVPSRPYPFFSLMYRLRATWLVWTGKADALLWVEQ